MKRKITLLLLAASSVLTMSSQVVLNEGFNGTTIPANWGTSNLSSPTGTLGWVNNGGYMLSDANAATGTGTISNWLITPTLNLTNGAVFSFYTISGYRFIPTVFPDRMQVRMSSTSNTTALISGGPYTVGTFTNLMLDINADYSTATSASAVNTGSTSGYPSVWTMYTVQVTGLPVSPIVGRFAFRYFVEGGGPTGSLSDLIGLDDVQYTLPCGPTVQSFTTCPNQPLVLTAQNGLPATTYLWTNSANSNTYTTSSINVTSGSSTIIYSLTPSIYGSVACNVPPATATISINNFVGSMSLLSSATTNTICSGDVVALLASDASSTYTWTPGLSNSALITVTPQTTTTYSVGSITGSGANICVAGASITINVLPTPTISFAITPSVVCPNAPSFTITSFGASTYTYGSSNVGNPLVFTSPNTPTSSGSYFVSVAGTSTNGCIASGNENFSVAGSPTIGIASSLTSGTIICRSITMTLTATGADTYSWSGVAAASASDNPIAYPTGTAQGTRTVTVIGTSTEGCSSSKQYVFGTNACVGIETIEGNGEASIFPNPFSNELRLSGISGSIEIYNTLGQVVIKAPVKSDEVINTAELTKGIYILRAYDASGELNKTVKLLKN